ncbi:MAG: hypothetical protein ACLUEW_11090 [Lachnospiraceae bacterium]
MKHCPHSRFNPHPAKGDYLTLSFHGDGFLQHMVRIMTGTLLEVGFHRMQPNDVITFSG